MSVVSKRNHINSRYDVVCAFYKYKRSAFESNRLRLVRMSSLSNKSSNSSAQETRTFCTRGCWVKKATLEFGAKYIDSRVRHCDSQNSLGSFTWESAQILLQLDNDPRQR